MKTRTLGRTGLEVGILGLGTEYLDGQDAETYERVLRTAVDGGVNYIDVLFSYADYRDRLGAAMRGIRESFVVTGHIGCAETNGQYRKTRDIDECETLFGDLLQRLGTDRVEIVMVQFVDTAKDYERIMSSGGLYELAQRLCREGKARHIGISIHEYALAEEAARSDGFDVIMYPLGIILSPIPRDDFLTFCEQNRVGVVAMKPFGGGRIFRYADSLGTNPSRLIGYPLLDSRVSTVIPGVKSQREMEQAIEGIDTAPDPGEFARYAEQILTAGKGDCVYCNHCLPCPVEINIGETLMLLDSAGDKDSQEIRDSYEELSVKASACTACSVCETRCPFDVSVIEKMEQAVKLFGS